MANRRMFAKTIIDSDAFMDMPLTTQALYFHLSMRADDDGFINNPRKIQRMIGASDDDLKLLIAKRFILSFDSGVVAIKHWKIHNYIAKDRYIPTVYQAELSLLETKKNGAYTEANGCGIPSDNQVSYQVETQYSKVKDNTTTTRACEEDKTVEDEPIDENISHLKLIGGTLGRGVVYLTDEQFDNLLDLLGADGFNRYVGRLAEYIIDKGAYVNNHYETILKWASQDSKCKTVSNSS